MSSRLIQTSISIDAELWSQVCDLADRLGIARSEVARRALEQYLAFKEGKGWDPHRAVELLEFCQLVLDQQLKAAQPELRDKILDAVVRRMEKYHGG